MLSKKLDAIKSLKKMSNYNFDSMVCLKAINSCSNIEAAYEYCKIKYMGFTMQTMVNKELVECSDEEYIKEAERLARFKDSAWCSYCDKEVYSKDDGHLLCSLIFGVCTDNGQWCSINSLSVMHCPHNPAHKNAVYI